METVGEEEVLARARDTAHKLYQLFKLHPHDQQWTKEAKPLSCVSWREKNLGSSREVPGSMPGKVS